MRHAFLGAAVATALVFASCPAFAQPRPQVPASQIGAIAHHTPPTGAVGADAIRTAIIKAGYVDIRHLHFDDGVWEAKARDAKGHRVELRIGAMTGKVYPEHASPRLSRAQVTAKLRASGYRNVHDVEFDDGLWEADAIDSRGRRVDVLVDPDDGSVVTSSPDR